MLVLCSALKNPCRKGLTGNHFYPHPESASKYIHCSQWGQMFVFDCGQGLVWDSSKQTCERKDFFHFFQNFPNSLHTTTRSNLQEASSIFKESLAPVTRIITSMPTQDPNFFQKLQTTGTTKAPILQNNINLVTQTNTFPATSFFTTFRTTTTRPPLTSTSTQQSFNQESTTRVFSLATLTTSATFIQQQPSVQPLLPSIAQNSQPGKTSSADCTIFSISGSTIPSVNGFYTRLSSSIIRRSDNFRIPGLLVQLDRSLWCLTLAFSFTDLSSINLELIKTQCGSNADCCMIISNSPDNLDVTDPQREWKINMLNSKGKKDTTIKFSCENQKRCQRIPFCPPECLKTVDGCEVCECNGKPFFDISLQNNDGSGQKLLSLTNKNDKPKVQGGEIQKTVQIVTKCNVKKN